jgi:hypothetical protein
MAYPRKAIGPVLVRFVREVARNRSEAIADHLPESGNETNGCGACPERSEKRSHDAPGALVGHVGEEVDHSNDQDKSEGEFAKSPLVVVSLLTDIDFFSFVASLGATPPWPHCDICGTGFVPGKSNSCRLLRFSRVAEVQNRYLP